MRYSLEYRGKSISLGSRNAVIGRSDACRVVLEGGDVSRRHARLRVEGELSDVPNIAKGTALNLIIAGILSLAFMGFAGLFAAT